MLQTQMSRRKLGSSCAVVLFLFLSVARVARTQQPVPSGPQAAPTDDPKPVTTDTLKNDRIFGVIPNYRTVEDPTQRIAPLTTKQKFQLAVNDSFDPYAYPIAGAFAAVGQAQNDPKSWGQGWGAFAKRYAAAFADQTSENMMVEAVVPSLLKQDPRYFRVEEGGFFKRTGYAVSRIWVTRTDAGHKTFNVSEIGGAGISSMLSNAYYPPENRTVSKTLSRWGILVGEDTLFNVLKEFWPDMRQRILKR